MPLSVRSSRVSRMLRLGSALLLVGKARMAFAEAPRACIDAVERGQSLRDQVKLIRAKASFLTCASNACPEIIQRDCAQWIAELETRIPTVIITASDASGHDVVYARVLVDGEHFADRLDGIAVPVDPGIHTFRLEPTNGPPLEQTVVIREAEKYQKEHFTLLAAAPTPAVVALPPSPRGTEPGTSDRAGYGTGAITAASVAGVAAGFFAGFAIAGVADVNHLNTSCSPRCSPGSVAGARVDLQIADVSLGVGVAALAVATWLYFEWRGHAAKPSADTAVGKLVLRF
jgi:hypothetical protein